MRFTDGVGSAQRWMESPSENANGSRGRLCSRKALCHPWRPAVPLSAPCKHQAKFPLQSCRSQPFRAKVIESNSHNVTMPLPTEMTSRYKRKHLIFIFISNASISLWYKRKHSGQKEKVQVLLILAHQQFTFPQNHYRSWTSTVSHDGCHSAC